VGARLLIGKLSVVICERPFVVFVEDIALEEGFTWARVPEGVRINLHNSSVELAALRTE
jgi:hypothetical protein